MIVIGVLNTKGGSGKTTIATNIATRACKDHRRVGLLDIDPQAGATRWHSHRARRTDIDPDRPAILTGETDPDDAIEALRLTGWDLIVIDGGASILDRSERAAALCDLVIIPMRSGDQDVGSTQYMAAACVKHGTPYLIVINDATTRTDKRAASVRKALRERAGQPVADTVIVRRALIEDAMATGQAATEFPQKAHAAARTDIERLYDEVTTRLRETGMRRHG